MKKVLNIILVSLLASSSALAKQPAFVTKETTGQAVIVGKDLAAAQKQARDEALREAVQQVAGVLLQADTVVANSVLVSDTITANTAGYIRSYEVLKEETQGSVVSVTVRAQVGTAKLDEDLQAVRGLVKKLGSKRLVIVVQEQTYDEISKAVVESNHIAAAVTESFKRDGWTILDPTYAAGQLNLAPGVAMGTPEAKKIADLSKADYVLYGTATFRNQDQGHLRVRNGPQVVFPVTGVVSLSMFATDSGSQLARSNAEIRTGTTQGQGMSYEHSAATLAKTRADEYLKPLRAKVVESLRDGAMNGNRLAVTVTGLDDFTAAKAFRGAINKAIKGVREVSTGNFGEGKAQFDVTFVGSTEDFATELAAARFKGRKVVVTGVTGNTVTASVASK